MNLNQFTVGDIRQIALVILMAGSLGASPASCASADVREAFAAYQAAWAKYQTAVHQAQPADEVRRLAEAYAQAQSDYVRVIGHDQPPAEPPTAVAATAATTPTAATTADASDNAPFAGRAMTVSASAASLSANLPALEAAVRTAPTAEAKAECMARLIEVASRVESPELIMRRVQQMRDDRSLPAKWRQWAAQRSEWIKLRADVGQRRVELKAASQACDRASSKYRGTSWWALPVKLTRGSAYLWDQFKLDQTYNKYSRAQQHAEVLQAPFMSSLSAAWNATEGELGGESARVVLLIDNARAWHARWWVLDQARETIDVQYFYAERDPLGLAFIGHLLVKAQQGVRIRLMLDGRGDSRPSNRWFREEGRHLLAALARHPNVIIRMYNPMMVSMSGLVGAPRRLVASNHDKIVLVDRRLAIIGGRNMADYYYADRATDPTAFRDGDVLLEGSETAQRIQTAFEDEFAIQQDDAFTVKADEDRGTGAPVLMAAYRAMDRHLRGADKTPMPTTWSPAERQACAQAATRLEPHAHIHGVMTKDLFATAETLPVTILDKHSFLGSRDDITDAYVRFIDGARREIAVQNPMVILTDRIDAALTRASMRGVKIYVHTNSPTSTDSMETQAMFMGAWKNWMQAMPTLRIWAFEKRKLHTKVMVVDSTVTVLGSYNLDYVSEQINSEICAAINGADFAATVRAGIVRDMGESREYIVKRDAKGRIVSDNGPETMVSGALKLKLELMSRLQFLKFLT